MLRLIDVLLAGALVFAACSSDPAQRPGVAGSAGTGSEAAPPVSVVDQVQRSVPAGAHAAPAGISVAGIDLVLLTTAHAGDDDAVITLVGVVGGVGGKLVEGPELLRAVIGGKPAPRSLARVALWSAQQDGDVLDAPASAEQHKAKVTGPAIHGDRFTFWVLTSDVPRMLEHGTLDLTTGALELAPLPVSHDVAIANAVATLTGVSVARHAAAIKLLAEACAEPVPRQALLAALVSHPRARSRVAVADEIHKCGAVAVEPLIYAMEQDKSAMVRTAAAGGLGRTGDKRARPSLAKAARSDDANLAWAASNALKKLQ